MKHHFRPDNSSYHVILYDVDGKVLAKNNTKAIKTNPAGHADTPGQCTAMWKCTAIRRTKST